jgi:hypothetical protein
MWPSRSSQAFKLASTHARLCEVYIKYQYFSPLTHIVVTMSSMGEKPGRARFLHAATTRRTSPIKCADFTSANRLARRKCAQ